MSESTAKVGAIESSQLPSSDVATIGFIGAGNMAEALIAGWRQAGVPGTALRACNYSDRARLARLADQYGISVSANKEAVVVGVDLVVLAVKPVNAAVATAELAPLLSPNTTVVSVMAGIPLADLRQGLGGHRRLLRAMPNTGCRVGQGVTALCAAADCDDTAVNLARDLFGQVGTAVMVEEAWFDAVTAVSGSGPAYVYLLVEAMIDAGISLGLPADVARTLAVDTVIGAGAMLAVTDRHPSALRNEVVSPGGTTAAALRVMEDGNVPTTLRRAVQRAAERAGELAQLTKAK